MPPPRASRFALPALLFALSFSACRTEQQVVQGVAKTAANAEHTAQVRATVLDQQRASLAAIPLPTKSMYADVHEPSTWVNPFLTVQASNLDLRITQADANPSTAGQDSMLRPSAARRQELQIRPSDLAEAMVAIPASSWRYGRVIAVAEEPNASAKDRAVIRRTIEQVIQQLNDLGIVVEEWPSR